MPFEVKYHPEVKKTDLPKIDSKNKTMVKKAIEERLSTGPDLYGKPLRRTLKGYWKLRVGEYRIIFSLSGKRIFIMGIIHRKDIYPQVVRRKIKETS
jgi:mRNA interferase RelE/StbE